MCKPVTETRVEALSARRRVEAVVEEQLPLNLLDFEGAPLEIAAGLRGCAFAVIHEGDGIPRALEGRVDFPCAFGEDGKIGCCPTRWNQYAALSGSGSCRWTIACQ